MMEVIILISGIFAILATIRFIFANGIKTMAKSSDQHGAINFLKSLALGMTVIIGIALSILL